MRYGEKEIKEFDVENMEIWPNDAKNDYIIKITLPEFMILEFLWGNLGLAARIGDPFDFPCIACKREV